MNPDIGTSEYLADSSSEEINLNLSSFKLSSIKKNDSSMKNIYNSDLMKSREKIRKEVKSIETDQTKVYDSDFFITKSLTSSEKRENSSS